MLYSISTIVYGLRVTKAEFKTLKQTLETSLRLAKSGYRLIDVQQLK